MAEKPIQFLLRHKLLNEQEIAVLQRNHPGESPLAAAVSAGLLSPTVAQDAGKLHAEGRFDGLDPVLPGLLLLAEIGKGAQGTVYRAWQAGLRRVVAVKVLPRELLRDKETRVRILREAGIAARLAHPSLVRCYDVGQTTEHVYLVLEYVEGETLSTRLRRDSKLPLADALGIAAGVADGLAFAAANGIAHRDIKPANIQLTRGHGVKILDLGLARPEGESTVTAPLVAHGTPAYIAPEQARGENRITPKVDVYALGAVLYRCLTGVAPFTAEDPIELLRKHVHEAPVALSQRAREVPQDVSDLVHKMLAKKPEDRPDAATVAGFLRLYAQKAGGHSDARGTSTRTPAVNIETTHARLSPAKVRGIGVGILVLAAVAAVVTFFVFFGFGDDRAARERELQKRERELADREKAATEETAKARAYAEALDDMARAAKVEPPVSNVEEGSIEDAVERAVRENDEVFGDK